MVKIYDTYSSLKTVTARVPQGSILGSLLFLIYINDLTYVVLASTALHFVDDLKLIFNGSCEQLDKLEQDFDNLQAWSNMNKLLFNYKKCSMSQLKPTNRAEQGERPIFEMNGTKIDWKTPVKDVGLVIDETLGWSENVKYRVRKAMKSFFMLKRNASSLLLQDRSLDLYRSILNITLLFGSESWELRKSEFHLIDER